MEYQYLKKGIYERFMELELQMFPSCCSCLNPNSYECNLPFGCINTVSAQSSHSDHPDSVDLTVYILLLEYTCH